MLRQEKYRAAFSHEKKKTDIVQEYVRIHIVLSFPP